MRLLTRKTEKRISENVPTFCDFLCRFGDREFAHKLWVCGETVSGAEAPSFFYKM